MTGQAVPQPERHLQAGEPPGRVIGHVVGDLGGPTLVCISGVHGNEPAGVEALRRVFAAIASRQLSIRGAFVGLAGNLPALAAGRRYISTDLNRLWTPRRIQSASPDSMSEQAELSELVTELERAFQTGREVFILDIHTTSGTGAPFLLIGDTLRNREFALRFPLPLVLGLEEYIDGTLSEYLTNAGHVTVSLEAGQHAAPEAVDNAEAAIWIALVAAGNVSADDLSEAVPRWEERLRRAARSVPRVLEVIHRHPVTPKDGFRMEPGFRNFDPVKPGQLLARDGTGEIYSRWRGRVLMPLYQELGTDGFFIIRKFSHVWLKISELLRRLDVHALAHWLPGVRRHPEKPDTLVVDRRVARWRSLEVLHLLGYRRVRAVGGILLVSRRSHDLKRVPAANEPA